MPEVFVSCTKLLLAAVLAGVIGAEREWTGKWAGLRTHMLIAVGSALFSDLSIRVGPAINPGGNWDPGRIAAQIVTGIGFLGAGTIIQSQGTVRGLTTAAGLWVAAAIGAAVGMGFTADAVLGTGAVLLILVALRPIERYLNRRHHALTFDLSEEVPLGDIADLIGEAGLFPAELLVSADALEARLELHGPVSRRQTLEDLAVERGISFRES